MSRSNQARDRVLRYIARYRDEHGYAPVLREIASGVGLVNSAAYYHMRSLRQDGLINFEPGQARTIVVTEAGREAYEQSRRAEVPQL